MLALANLIQNARGKSSQTLLAASVGVAQTTVSAWERGASLPPRTRIPSLALALGVPVDDLRLLVESERLMRSVHGGDSTTPAAAEQQRADAGVQQ